MSRHVVGGVTTVLLGFAAAPSLPGQYPLTPSPVLDVGAMPAEPRLSGYISVRQTWRADTGTFAVNRARMTLQVRPIPWTAMRLQTDFAAIGRTNGDTVAAFVLTDAYVQFGIGDSARGSARRWRPAAVVGQFRTPFSLEFLTPFSLLASVNRSRVVDRLATRRDIGVLGRVGVGSPLTLMAALVNGEGPNRTSNPDGRQMTVARLTFRPVSPFAVSAKWASQRDDRRWGVDARWLGKRLLVEGESIGRRGPVSGAATALTLDASGEYVLAAFRVRSWLRPMLKWEHFRESSSAPAAENRVTWVTSGVDVLPAGDRMAVQIDVIARRERSVAARNELVAQLKALF